MDLDAAHEDFLNMEGAMSCTGIFRPTRLSECPIRRNPPGRRPPDRPLE
jgi:hypothetical protein